MLRNIIYNYCTKLMILAFIVSLIGSSIPDMIILSVHWKTNLYYDYCILFLYVYGMIVIILRKILLLIKDRLFLTMIFNAFIAILFTAITCYYIYLLWGNIRTIKTSPALISILYHTIMNTLIIVVCFTKMCILFLIDNSNYIDVFSLMFNVSLFNMGGTVSIEPYNYNMVIGRLERNHDILELDFYDAVCIICKKEYSENTKVIVLDCKHHYHKKCGNKLINNSTQCGYCSSDIL